MTIRSIGTPDGFVPLVGRVGPSGRERGPCRGPSPDVPMVSPDPAEVVPEAADCDLSRWSVVPMPPTEFSMNHPQTFSTRDYVAHLGEMYPSDQRVAATRKLLDDLGAECRELPEVQSALVLLPQIAAARDRAKVARAELDVAAANRRLLDAKPSANQLESIRQADGIFERAQAAITTADDDCRTLERGSADVWIAAAKAIEDRVVLRSREHQGAAVADRERLLAAAVEVLRPQIEALRSAEATHAATTDNGLPRTVATEVLGPEPAGVRRAVSSWVRA